MDSQEPTSPRSESKAWWKTVIAAVFVVIVLIILSIPIIIEKRKQYFDDQAKSTGRNIKLAEEVYCGDRQSYSTMYTSSLALLLTIDKDLTNDPSVTFSFLYVTNSGYTFYTKHAKGTGKTFVYHD